MTHAMTHMFILGIFRDDRVSRSISIPDGRRSEPWGGRSLGQSLGQTTHPDRSGYALVRTLSEDQAERSCYSPSFDHFRRRANTTGNIKGLSPIGVRG